MAQEIRGNGWNLPTRQHNLPENEQIERGYRTIKSDSLEEANKLMEENYKDKTILGIFNRMYNTSFAPCHCSDSKDGTFSFIVYRTLAVL